MSIERLSKVSLCGHRDDKEPVLADLQRLGFLHLVSLADAPREPERAPPRYPEDCYQALRYLNDTPRKLRQIHRNPKFAPDATVGEVLRNRQSTRDATDRRDFLTERCKALEPWGDFELPPEAELAGYKLWFYILPVGQRSALEDEELVWQIVYQDNLNLYVAVVAREEPATEALPVPRTHAGAVPLGELREALAEVEIELETLAVEREALTRWIFLLTQNLARAEDETALVHATTQTLDDERVFAVQGWVATRTVPAVEAFASERELAFLVEEPADAESPPTLLRNGRRIEGGEDLVKFYETPGYRTWDPSGVVFFSFALFFAMILGDAGYAIVVAGIVAAYWKRMGESDTGRRLRGVFAAVAAASIGYGMLVGSYFGVTPPEDSFLARFHVLDLNDFGSMMRLSIVIGCTHLVMANVAQAWHAWSLSARIAPLAWSAVILGGLALWFSSTGVGPPQTMKTGGIALMGAGLLAVLLFAGQRRVRSAGDALKRLLDGLIALTNVTKIFGDVLSYMRLFALGLASASLALTFNQLAHDAGAAIEGPGLLVQILILVVGHALNLALALMSGVVHGLRLNVIEFFNWGLTEEGYAFRPFAKKEIEQ